MDAHQHFIGGDRVPGRASLRVVNPWDGQVMAEIARGGAAEIDRAVRAAHAAMDGEWGRMDASARGRLLLRLSRKVRSGQVFVNNHGAGGGAELPFGGVKGSEARYGFGAMKMIAIKHEG